MSSQLQDPMTALWLQVSQKEADGTRVIVWKNDQDLDLLYYTGFVDTDKFTLIQWKEAHQDFKQKEASYRLKLKDWMGLKKYRYDGIVSPLFEPETLKEGVWSEVQFDRFLKEIFLPQVTCSEKQFREALKTTGNKIFDKGGYKITKAFKNDLKIILETFPSPKRAREIAVYVYKEMNKKGGITPKISERSSFTQGPTEAAIITNKLSQILNR